MMTTSIYKAALLLCAATVFSMAAAHADVIDQRFEPLNAQYCGAFSSCEWQQVVTPGVTGTLTGLQIFTHGSPVDLRIGSGSGPVTGNWLAELNQAPTNGFIDLSSFNIHITAGQPFVFDVRNSFSFLGTYTFNDPNPAGNLYLSLDGSPLLLYHDGHHNLGYVTRMNPVPEPETWALLLTGIGLITLASRRRKKE